ncbi:MAG: hypothetical protein A3K75_04825 [Euryarchaeota archaeon RBG_13_61_15]|nr:MAG: hypothetical protein A3K75_04825 [Euryarchaeota archaeon RBG_13_61_15]
MVALSSAIVVGLLLVPGSVSAGTLTAVAEDPEGDLGFGVDPKTGGIMNLWADNTPVAKAEYLDIVSTWLSLKKGTYTFGMELAAALPEEGSALPGGIKLAEWAVWIDPSPYNYITNPVAPLFLIALRYDGSSYSAFIMDYGTMLTTSVAFSVDGSKVQLQFTSASIGDLAFEWWSPLVRVWWGILGSAGCWFVDAVNLEPVDGYIYIDLPWPPQ